MAAHESVGEAVLQPAFSAAQNLDGISTQSQFFVELAEKSILGSLVILDAALRELPRVLPHPASPQNLPALVRDDNSYVWSIPVAIDHGE